VVPESGSVLKTTVLTDVSPLNILLASRTFYERAGVARRVDVENLLDGLGDAHV
jgi:hypothetical protein